MDRGKEKLVSETGLGLADLAVVAKQIRPLAAILIEGLGLGGSRKIVKPTAGMTEYFDEPPKGGLRLIK